MKKRAKAANKPITFTAVFLDRLKKLARIFGDLFGRHSKSIWVESETSSVFATNGHWGVKLPAPVGLLWYLFRRLNEQTQNQAKTDSKTTQQPIWRRLLGW